MLFRSAFVGNVHGVGGLFFRGKPKKGQGGPKLVLLAMFVRHATYKPRFGFKEKVNRVARLVLPVAFRASLAKALATARR